MCVKGEVICACGLHEVLGWGWFRRARIGLAELCREVGLLSKSAERGALTVKNEVAIGPQSCIKLSFFCGFVYVLDRSLYKMNNIKKKHLIFNSKAEMETISNS